MENQSRPLRLETKALYSSLAMVDRSKSTKKTWETREWRNQSLENLVSELHELGFIFDKKQFYHWAGECDTPEELFELAVGDEENDKKRDHFYLILFELWRRLVPEKRSLSIIADDIDHCIQAFDLNSPILESQVEALLGEWGRVLDSLRDAGRTEEEALEAIEPFFAHDVPDFVIDFLLDLLGRKEYAFAAQILEKVGTHCVREPLWIKFIELQLALHDENVIEVRKKLGELVSALLTMEECDVELTLALCDIALELQKEELLVRLLEKLLPHLEEKEDFLAVLELLEDVAFRRNASGVLSKIKRIQNGVRSQSRPRGLEILTLVQEISSLL